MTEIFSGGVLAQNSWISWSGGVHSLTGNLYGSGWRMRVLGAYGKYVYDQGPFYNQAEPVLVEVTPGYQWRKGPLISKLFVGLHVEKHRLARPDANNTSAPLGYGLKLVSENWLNLPWDGFVSVDASFSTRNNAFQASIHTGAARLVRRITLGPEAHIIGNGEHFQLRGGGFARYRLEKGSIELSGGLARDYLGRQSPYFGMSWLRKY